MTSSGPTPVAIAARTWEIKWSRRTCSMSRRTARPPVPIRRQTAHSLLSRESGQRGAHPLATGDFLQDCLVAPGPQCGDRVLSIDIVALGVAAGEVEDGLFWRRGESRSQVRGDQY